jgi:flavin reductase (DIM6/NTAB) family NADH-FMN oxidoreductase RutF
MIHLFKSVPVKQLKENLFHLLDDEWMLISAGQKDEINMMTASWGGFGILWNKPVAYIVIRPQRYTYELINRSDVFSLSFLEDEFREELSFCGTKSGREVDKVKDSGLTPFSTPNSCYSFKESKLFLECKKLYADHLKPEFFLDTSLIDRNYPKLDFHQLTIGEIIGCYKKIV